MSVKREQEYINRHERIKNKLVELDKESKHGFFEVVKLASELGMDKRTVKAHLRIMELDNFGVFVDQDEKQFCTREGVSMFAEILRLDKNTEW
ncbi:hypothetical protein ACFLWU_02710 [Chloroflexota bacterium]